jgi:hypothetical protein
MNAFRYLALFLGLTLACQSLAVEGLIGEYSGKLGAVEGYSGNAGDPCTVLVEKSDMYGGSLTFEIRNVEKLLVQTGGVEKELQSKSNNIKISTSAGSGKPVEIVVLILSDEGRMQNLKLMLKGGPLRRNNSVSCGDLVKK